MFGPAAKAFDDFLPQALATSGGQRIWQESDGLMPALYLSHGAPPLFEDATWIDELFAWSQSMPKPTAIVIVSAHWESAPLCLSSPDPSTPLVYDFGGFDQRYYTMTYATPDATELARTLASRLSDQNLHMHNRRGLDHGAWVPLKVMYPLADVPVLQLSIPTHDPSALLGLGERLRELRSQGVLIIGSGFMTHGLPFMTSEMFLENKVPGWSRDFDLWAEQALASGDVESLCSYTAVAPGLPYAHPTVEHYIPLFVTLGAATDPEAAVRNEIDGFAMGLSKRSFSVA